MLAACIRHYSPRLGRQDWTAVGAALRESHPSEDLSELPPLIESVAGQGYHCRRTRALQCSLPRLLWDGRVPLDTLFLGPLIETVRENLIPPLCLPRFYRWSWRVLRIACPFFKARLLMLSSCRIFNFQRLMKGHHSWE